MRFKNGLSIFGHRNSAGNFSIASYHPPGCLTWHWIVVFSKYGGGEKRHLFKIWKDKVRTNQWHDYLFLPHGKIIISRQNYHLQKQPTHYHDGGELQ